MTVAVYLPLLLALPLAWAVRRMAARGAPGLARTLVAASVVTASASTWSLLLLSSTLLDDLPPLSALDDDPRIELPEPVPGPVALVAGLLLLAGAVRLVRDLHRRHGTLRRLRRAGRAGDGLVVADWAVPLAVAVPGRPGHVLVTAGMLGLLDADERRVMFAHERAHLDRRHHRLVTLAAAAAAVDPLLIPVRDAIAYLVERQADEDAAAVVGDRELTARAVARAALASASASPGPALAIGGGAAVRRVRALRCPEPVRRRRDLAGPALVAAGILAASAVATVEFVALARAWL
jgi:Zn-dependent protease with chaperone function